MQQDDFPAEDFASDFSVEASAVSFDFWPQSALDFLLLQQEDPFSFAVAAGLVVFAPSDCAKADPAEQQARKAAITSIFFMENILFRKFTKICAENQVIRLKSIGKIILPSLLLKGEKPGTSESIAAINSQSNAPGNADGSHHCFRTDGIGRYSYRD